MTDIENRLDEEVIRVFRYIDNYLMLFRSKGNSEREGFISRMLEVFKDSVSGLNFTSESPGDGTLNFLDLKILLRHSHVCWFYCPRAKEGMLACYPLILITEK